ncbi:BOI-related E3 ubiquitin-protein ligase 1 [Nymphaea thermarum]|nr:BOI-related E3 ubiquitin-protein ligase 1 [Nymphaea thermarum]
MVVLERTIVKKLKQKEAEIKSIGRVNCALEERVRYGRTSPGGNEAMANALRSNLEQVLPQANEGRKEDAGADNKFEN